MFETVAPHLPLLVRSEAQVCVRLCRAEQDETRRQVLGKIRFGAAVIEFSSANQAASARQAASLVTNRRKRDATGKGRIPNALIWTSQDRSFPFRGFQNYAKFRITVQAVDFRSPPPGSAAWSTPSRERSKVLPPSMGCRSLGSCCMGPRPAHPCGSGLRESIFHRVRGPAAR